MKEYEIIKEFTTLANSLREGNEQQKYIDEYSGIQLCIEEPYCHIYSGIDFLANLLGAKTEDESIIDGRATRRFFRYHGVKFFQISDGEKDFRGPKEAK